MDYVFIVRNHDDNSIVRVYAEVNDAIAYCSENDGKYYWSRWELH